MASRTSSSGGPEKSAGGKCFNRRSTKRCSRTCPASTWWWPEKSGLELPRHPPNNSGLPKFPFLPAPARTANMVGGKISGSNGSATEGFHVLAEIKEEPREQEWTDLVFSNSKLYRWLRYDAPPGSHGCVAELEFYSGTKKLDGYRF